MTQFEPMRSSPGIWAGRKPEALLPFGVAKRLGRCWRPSRMNPTRRKAKLANGKQISDNIILAPYLAVLEVSLS